MAECNVLDGLAPNTVTALSAALQLQTKASLAHRLSVVSAVVKLAEIIKSGAIHECLE